MPEKRLIVQLGMGTDITGGDYTKAAVRGRQDALRHNSISIANALGQKPEDMKIDILIGVQKPDEVDAAAVAASLPRGSISDARLQSGPPRAYRSAETST